MTMTTTKIGILRPISRSGYRSRRRCGDPIGFSQLIRPSPTVPFVLLLLALLLLLGGRNCVQAFLPVHGWQPSIGSASLDGSATTTTMSRLSWTPSSRATISRTVATPAGTRTTFTTTTLNNSSGRTEETGEDHIDEDDDDNWQDEEPMLVADVRGRPAGVVLGDLNWRVERLRLEEANTRRFLKAGPRFLPYGECRKWVQAWGRWRTEAEWDSWIAAGEKRNSYIPSRPEEYYTRTGDWISWDHFLGVQPPTKPGDDDL